MPAEELVFLPAVEQLQRLRRRELSAHELITAYLQQIERVNPRVNAIVTLVADAALAAARQSDERRARGDNLGLLEGLPVVHKDLLETKGIRTTFGSPIYRDYVPTFDALTVQRWKQAGAITLGKTNTPEFGAGSQTFNPVFGATPNPYDLSRTCGGSSGGAAVRLACGLTSLADGSDTGGSLRNPASFCNVVGLRPSPGRVPVWPDELGWFTLSVEGPLARTVQDLALSLSALSGPDPRSPIAIREPGRLFQADLQRDWRDVRLAWSPTLGGLPVESQVLEVLQTALPVLRSLGCQIEEADPGWQDADEIFKVLRAWRFDAQFGELLKTHRDQLKDTIIWNAEEGARLSGAEIAAAERKRTRLFHRLRHFFDRFDYLLAPVVQVLPFGLEQPYVREINGQPMSTYIDWMKSCYYISIAGLPALSVPAGFSREGLPVGLQIIGPHQNDFAVLQLGYAFQEASNYWQHRPTIAAPTA
jgi:amidase